MDDVKFDELLHEAGSAPRVDVGLLQQLALETQGQQRRPRRRTLRVAATAFGGAVLLAAGAGAAALMKVPPFQSVEPDMYRTQASISVDYRSVTGHENHCLAFLEFTDLTVAQADQADTLVRRHNWSGIGQAVYDQAAAGSTDRDVIDGRFADLLGQRLHSVAVMDLPEMASSRPDADGKAAWNGYSFSCAGGQQ